MNAWYYVDAGHNRQGPVSGEDLAAAYRQGRVNRDTLVWRDGLPQWVPLERHLAELPAAPPTLPEAAAVPGLPAGAATPASPAGTDPDEVVDAGFIRRLGAYLIGALSAYFSPWVAPLVGIAVAALAYVVLFEANKALAGRQQVAGA